MPSAKENPLRSLYKKEPQLINYGIIALALVVVAVVLTFAHGGGAGVGQCNGILLSSYRYGCLGALAISSNNYTLCSGLPSQYSDACFTAIAQNTENQTLCNRLSTPQGSYNCAYGIANETGSYSACTSLSGGSEDNCLTSIGVAKADVNACNDITNASNSMACRYSVELRSALTAGSPMGCIQVTNSTNSSLTASVAAYSGIYQYSGASGRSSGLGGALSSFQQSADYVQFLPNVSYSPRDLCYLYFASATGNATYCGRVPNFTVSRLCNESVESQLAQEITQSNLGGKVGVNSTALGNLTNISAAECANLTLSKSTCNALSKIYNAVSTRNQSACAALAGTYQYQCYSSLARAYQNSTYCGYISNASANGACVDDVYYNNTI